MGEKLTAQPEKITGFADDDLIHTVAGGDSWKVKYINLIKFFWTKISGRDIVNSGNGYITINDYTSLDIFSSQPTTFTTTLDADTSANHLILLSSGGTDFVTVTINSYPSPKDGAIVQLRLSEKGTTNLIICGVNWPGSAFAAGLYTIRYSSLVSAWLPINFVPFTFFSGAVSTDDVTNDSLYAGTTQTDVNNVAKSIIYAGGSNPGVNQDSTQGFSVGSLFVNQSSGVTFRAEDVAVGAAVWVVNTGNETLQTAYDGGNAVNGALITIDGVDNVNGFGNLAANGNTGLSVNGLGRQAAQNNTGSYVNGLGLDAALDNAGSNVNALGMNAANGNTGNNVAAIGNAAAQNNTGGDVNGLGSNATKGNTGDRVNGFGVQAALNNTGNNVNALGTTAANANAGVNVNGFGNNAAKDNTKDNVNALGAAAASGNTGASVNALGADAANSNTGASVNALGADAANGNTGEFVNALGAAAALNNTGSSVNALGGAAASGNTGSNVNALGMNAANGNTGNNVNGLGFAAASGNTGANVTAIGNGAGLANILSKMVIFGANQLTEYANHAAAVTAITVANGATAGNYYIYANVATNSIGYVKPV